jgi:hypothetical protein
MQWAWTGMDMAAAGAESLARARARAQGHYCVHCTLTRPQHSATATGHGATRGTGPVAAARGTRSAGASGSCTEAAVPAPSRQPPASSTQHPAPSIQPAGGRRRPNGRSIARGPRAMLLAARRWPLAAREAWRLRGEQQAHARARTRHDPGALLSSSTVSAVEFSCWRALAATGVRRSVQRAAR